MLTATLIAIGGFAAGYIVGRKSQPVKVLVPIRIKDR